MNDSGPVVGAVGVAGPVAAEAPAPAAAAAAAATAEQKAGGVGMTIARNSVWMLLDSAFSMFSQLYCSVAIARGLGPDRMGDYNYVLWFASVLRTATELAIPITFRKFAAELMGRGDYNGLKGLVRYTLKIQMRMALLGVTVGMAIALLSTPVERRAVVILAIVSVVPALLTAVPTGAIQATEKLRYNVAASLCATLTNLSGITLSVIFHWGLVGVVSSFLASRVVDCILRFIMFRKLYAELPGEAGPGPIDPELRRRMIRFVGNQLVLMIFQVLLWERTEVFFLRKLSAVRQIAFFSMSVTLVQQLVLQIPNTLAGSAGVSLMVQQGRDPRDAARMAGTAVWFTLLVAAPMLFGIAAISDPLLRLLYGVKYLEVIPVLTMLAILALGQALQLPIGPYLQATEQQPFIIKWASVMVVINVTCCLLLIPSHGALGAVYARGLCHLVGAAGFLVFMNRRLGVPLPVFRMAKLVAVCVVMFFGVRSLQHQLPSLAALLAGIPIGVAIFVVLTRLLRCLDDADGRRLRQLARMFPARARAPYLGLVDFVVRA